MIRQSTVLICLLSLACSSNFVRSSETPTPTPPFAVMQGERLVAEVSVNDKRATLMVDTGSGHELVLYASAANQLNCTVSRVRGRTWAKGCRLSIMGGGEAPGGCDAFVLPIDSPGLHGILGWPALREHCWSLDMRSGVLRRLAGSPTPPQASSWTALPILPDTETDGLALATGSGLIPTLIVDTGLLTDCMIPSRYWDQWRSENPNAWSTLCTQYSPSAGGGFFVVEQVFAETFSIGDLDLGPCFVAQNVIGRDRDLEARIGITAMLGHEYLIDGRQGKFFAKRQANRRLAVHGILAAQATFAPIPGAQLLQAHVIAGGSAWKQGLRTGDLLVAVNGLDASRWVDDHRVRPGDFLAQEAGTKVDLELLRGDQRKYVSVILPSLPSHISEAAWQGDH